MIKQQKEFIQRLSSFTELWASLRKHSRWRACRKIPNIITLKWPDEDISFTAASNSTSSKAPSVPETWPCSTCCFKSPGLLHSASVLHISQDTHFPMQVSLGWVCLVESEPDAWVLAAKGAARANFRSHTTGGLDSEGLAHPSIAKVSSNVVAARAPGRHLPQRTTKPVLGKKDHAFFSKSRGMCTENVSTQGATKKTSPNVLREP